MARISTLTNWLQSIRSPLSGNYSHQLISESSQIEGQSLDDVREYFDKAHQDALNNYQKVVEINLSPFASGSTTDPTSYYPKKLHISTLKTYLGEVMAGVIAENFSPCGEDRWQIPVFLLRWHNVAFEQLEKSMRTGREVGLIPGRTGDDCLAFVMNDEGKIEKTLYCESKCTSDHDAGLIADGYKKLNEQSVSIFQMIQILLERPDAESQKWANALSALRLDYENDAHEQCDLLCYVYSRQPIRNQAWLNTAQPHRNYTANRRLEGVEIRLGNVDDVVRNIYRLNE